jgi:branched-subunit amino acid transport protein
MTNFAAILIVGIGTYFFRSVFIVGVADRTVPPNLVRALEFVAPAVISALVISLLVDNTGSVAAGVPEVAALAAGGLAGWKTRNLIYTVLAGMAVFWIAGIWF